MEKERNTPINREDILQPFSKEHHYSFLLSWKIRKGLDNGIALERIKNYTDWFYDNYIKSHLEDEEKYIFPILGKDHKLIKKSMSRHRRLKRLFKDQSNLNRTLNQIEEELDQHLRFEERELFKVIQKKATPEELKKIKESKQVKKFVENEEDIFWD